MKKTVFCISLFLSFSLFAQKDAVLKSISVFPYQQKNSADVAIRSMQSWNAGNWNLLLSMLDDDSLRLQASYALSAYIHQSATDKKNKLTAATHLSEGLPVLKTYYAKELVIKYLGLLGENVAIKPLEALLMDEAYSSNAARALAAIHSPEAISVLSRSIIGSNETIQRNIQAAFENVYTPLPDIREGMMKPLVTTINPVQKLLRIQDSMDAARNPLQKRALLYEAARIPGISSFLFVSKCLDDVELAADVAPILARLAIAGKDIRGQVVREALLKAIPLINGEDSASMVKNLTARLKAMPYDYGFVSLFNGKNLDGWKALVGNPITRAKMSAKELLAAQKTANEKTKGDWVVKDGLLVFTGHGDNLATEKPYGNFEMLVDWKITKDGDAGIYLRGSPQVQIWDTSRRDVGAQVGSGGLYNNQVNASKPLLVADNKIGEWNRFHIIMKGEKVTVYLNGQLVTNEVVLENYWDRKQPIFPKEQIELQAHGTYVAYRNIYLRELPEEETTSLSEAEKKQGFNLLFDGKNMDQWTGNTAGYLPEEGAIVVHPELSGGNLYTKETYADFEYRFEFQLTPGANNGIGIRTPLEGDAAYVGMEIQVLDNEAEMYRNLQPYQYHGSVYGVIPAKRGFLKPIGEWNQESIIARGSHIQVVLNGQVIVDGDLREASQNGTMDHKAHPGLLNPSGHIGFLGHGDIVRFRNIRIKRL